MDLISNHRHGINVITVNEARIDASVAIKFKDTMRALTETGPAHVILDLSGVDFVDSSGLGAIVAAMKQLSRDKQMDLAGLTPNVDKVFRLTRMDSIFTIHENAADPVIRAAG